jgi:Fur family ferric uptake transcriptional regulator
MQTQQPLKSFEEFLRSREMKNSRPRAVVVKEALNTQGHFTADDLWIKAQKRERRISRATVYRTLQLLTQSRLIEPRDFEQGKLYYEQMVGHNHHDHLICLECGKITEFENQEIEELQEKVARKYSFAITSHSHKMYGACSRCRQGKTKEKEREFKIKF